MVKGGYAMINAAKTTDSIPLEEYRFKELPCIQRLPSSLDKVNHLLDGGLAFGQISEWGIPWGNQGRQLILSFLTMALQQGQWCLWVQRPSDTTAYAPAWQALGVPLERLKFVEVDDPIQALKPLFMSDFFKVIIIDCPLTPKEYAFLAKRARVNRQLIITIRSHYLSTKLGNVWAKSRLNCWMDPLNERFYLRVIKGASPRQFSFTLAKGA